MQVEVVHDGLQKVRFAQPRSAVDVEGVENRARVFRHRLRRREHEFVALARNERFEGEARVYRDGRIIFVEFLFVGAVIGFVAAFHHQHEVCDARVRFRNRRLDLVFELMYDGLCEKFCVRFQHDARPVDVDGFQTGNVGGVCDVRERLFKILSDRFP